MQQLGLNQVLTEVAKLLTPQPSGQPPAAQSGQRAFQMLGPALNQFPDHPALWFYMGLYYQQNFLESLAEVCWRRSFELEPQPAVLGNLGAALKASARPEVSRDLLRRAFHLLPRDPGVICNMTGSFVNEGNPWEGIEVGRQAIADGLDTPQTKFNTALLLLESGQYAQGFELYASGEHEYRDRRTYPGATRLTAGNFEEAKGKRLLVYGEQGIGDELMFATMLGDIANDFEVMFEHHPRSSQLYESAPWYTQVDCQPNRKIDPTDRFKPGELDYFCAIGDMAQFYRRTPESFAWKGPYYRVREEDARNTRTALEQYAEGRQIIGLSFRGGTMKTNRPYRSLQVEQLKPILNLDAYFVLLDYDDVSQELEWIHHNYGARKAAWFPSISWAWDYHHLGVLMAACDRIITVNQSGAHLAAAMGLETHVLTPYRAAWRYGLGRERPDQEIRQAEPWYWYPSGRSFMHRQLRDGVWQPAIESLMAKLAEESNA